MTFSEFTAIFLSTTRAVSEPMEEIRYALLPSAVKRRVIANIARDQVNAIRVPVFVTVYVLHIDHRPAVLGPEVLADAAFFVGGHHFVIVLAEGFHPDLENVVGVGRDPGQAAAV